MCPLRLCSSGAAFLLGLAVSIAPAQLVRQANNTLNLPATAPVETGYTTENALGSLTFSSPIDVASPPGVTNRLFVIERNSGIQIVNLESMTKSTFLPLASYLSSLGRPLVTQSESGILSLAFHPNYNENGYFYVFYSLSISGQLYQRIARFTATGTPGNYNAATVADPATEQPLITQRDEAANHNGGDMAFGPDGYLYISVGDEGAQRDGNDNARRIAKDFFGAILRIDVDQRPGSLDPNPHDESSTATVGDSAIHPGTYKIPPDNPFVALAQGGGNATYNGFTFPKTSIRTEIYAIGFRNPWRMSFDPETGRLFVADVGQDTYEEVNIVTNGFNGGWSWREGLHPHTPAAAPTTPPVGFLGQDPIFEYDHTNNGIGSDSIIYGSSITGGVVYRGDSLPELRGKYLFCDYNTGFIVALEEQQNGTWTGTRIAQDANISGWGYDPRNGDALLCDLTGNMVKRLRRAAQGAPPPATLSAVGAFSDLTTLTPQAGIVSYEPNVAFWSDYAIKSRWFSIKNLTDTIGFNANGSWTFPTGMVWIKHFDIELERGNPATRRKLETRILVKTTNDVYGLSYRWNNIAGGPQTEAHLIADAGLTEPIPGSTHDQVWRFPSRGECRVCHTNVGGFALSFNTRQLNRSHTFGALSQNQIAALSSAGYFSQPVTGVNYLPAFAPADDTSTSLEHRVRSYLAVNCVQCHQPGGASSGNWDARPSTPTDAAGLINGPLVNNDNDPANRFAVPGDLAHSMVLRRLRGDGMQRMPPLATNERDLVAEQLISDWITQALPSYQTFAQWQQTHFQSTISPDSQPEADPDFDGEANFLEYLRGTSPIAPTKPLTSAAVPSSAGGMFSLQFEHPANRSCLIETTTDFQTWQLWDVPGNSPMYPATTITRTLQGPMDGPQRFFRFRIEAR